MERLIFEYGEVLMFFWALCSIGLIIFMRGASK